MSVKITDEMLDAFFDGFKGSKEPVWNDRVKAGLEAALSAHTATITFTRAMGIYGKAYDLPGPHRAYTYEHQPDNQAAYRLGTIAAMLPEGGDHIDYGLYLLRAMQESGFGVFEIEPIIMPAAEGK